MLGVKLRDTVCNDPELKNLERWHARVGAISRVSKDRVHTHVIWEGDHSATKMRSEHLENAHRPAELSPPYTMIVRYPHTILGIYPSKDAPAIIEKLLSENPIGIADHPIHLGQPMNLDLTK